MYSVIVIDDNKITVEVISKSVDWGRLGYRVTGTAYGGVAGLELIHNSAPNIVITGIRMPGFSGLDVIKEIQGTRKDIRFTIISDYNQSEYAQQATRYDVNDYLLKPTLTKEMEQALKYMTDTLYKKEVGTAPGRMDSLEGRIYGIRSGRDGYPSMVSQTISYVGRNVNRNTFLRDVCDELLVPMSYFSKCFEKETGAGFSSYVIMMKVENVRILLKNSKDRVNEMTHMLGYSDYACFFQVLRKQSGYSFGDIKLNVKKEDKKNDSDARK